MKKPKFISKKQSLKEITWWKVGGEAEFFVAPESLDELKEALIWAKSENHEVTIMSGGTNILVSDEGIKGLVVGMSNLSGTESNESDGFVSVVSWAGSNKAEALKVFLQLILTTETKIILDSDALGLFYEI